MRLLRFLLLAGLTAAPGAGAQDTVVVRADNTPAWGEAPRLVEELRLGSLAGEEAYTFGSVGGVAVTSDGTVWVADHLAGVIRRYSASGEHIGDSGRKGEGPGEFKYLLDLRTLQGDSVAAWDPLNQRIHVFGPDGAFARDVRAPVAGVLVGANLQIIEVDTAGFFYTIDVSHERDASGERTTDAYWLRIAERGGVVDTVDFRPSNSRGTIHPVRSWTALSPMGYAVTGRNDAYALHRPLPDGRTLRLERSWKPVPYEPDERGELQMMEEHFAARNGRPVRDIPPEKPAWASFEVDRDGRIWVETYAPGVRVEEGDAQREARMKFENPKREWTQPLTYDVIDPRGRFLGSLTFPNSAGLGLPRVDVRLASGDEVWVVERGEYDEQYVVRYRIVPG